MNHYELFKLYGNLAYMSGYLKSLSTNKELIDLLDCPITTEDYIGILRQKRVITE